MSQSITATLPAVGHPAFDLLLRESQAWLAERGEILVGSGAFRSGRLSAAVHSDFGPTQQDKAANQDYVLAWRSASDDSASHPRLVLALADGLTTSYRSECASALACWIAVRGVVEAVRTIDPQGLARFAFDRAGHTIGRLADEWAREPEASCPTGQFLSTWKYILAKGRLLQTTLTLAWLDHDKFCLAMVGDGGALWRDYRGPGRIRTAADRVLAACDLENQQVFAVGPADREAYEFDCWHEESLNGPFLCALSTDGIGRSQGAIPATLLDELEAISASGVENPARQFIDQAIRDRSEDFDDNLTLAVVRAE